MKKRKITVGTLAELAKRMPVLSEEVQRSFIGGGDGTQTNPFTESEFDKFLSSGHFPGGYVLFNGDTSGTYISASCGTSGVVVTNKEIKDGEFVLMSKFAEENIDATGNMIKKTFEAVTGILCNPSGSMIDTFCNNFVYESITQDSSVINSQRVFRVKEKMVSSNTGKPLYRYNWYNEEGHLLGTTYHYGR